MRVASRAWLPPLEVAAIWAMATLVLVLAIAIFLIGYDALVANLAKLNFATLVLCFLLMGWQVGGRFLRWMWYARCLGLPLSVLEGALFYGAGLGMTLTPGRLGGPGHLLGARCPGHHLGAGPRDRPDRR